MGRNIASFNPNHLLKEQLRLYITARCKHGKTYIGHPACFQREILDSGKEIRIGVLDIENFGMNFNADVGLILTYYIKEYNKENYYSDMIDYKDLYNPKIRDKMIIKNLLKDMKNFDIFVTFNGTYFDLPYIRTRCLIQNMNFLNYGDFKHIDLYFILKNKFKLKYKSLQNACRQFHIKGKEPLPIQVWIDTILGDKTGLEKIYSHNKGDVIATDGLYTKIIKYSRKINRSI